MSKDEQLLIFWIGGARIRQGNSIWMQYGVKGTVNRYYYGEGEDIETNKFNTFFIRGAHLGRMMQPVV
jgi:hypothetical protein